MKRIVGMATTKQRRKYSKLAIASLQDQCDGIILYDNDKEAINLTDNGKFYGLENLEEPVYYFSTDDDIIYPKDYIERTVEAIEKYNCIVTYHGRKLTGLNQNYYRDHKQYSCLLTIPRNVNIDVCGTGVTAFSTAYFNPVGLCYSEYKRMSDCLFSLEAAFNDKEILLLSHKKGDFIDLKVEKELSICAVESGRCETQNTIADIIQKLKGCK